jgi:hypothetical protein
MYLLSGCFAKGTKSRPFSSRAAFGFYGLLHILQRFFFLSNPQKSGTILLISAKWSLFGYFLGTF